ncbi:oxidoreductase [Thalassotalea sp. M1531]|uniref:Oxidoreductase n=1 Tax=Thalassotalea algicola TaxID=2716224 RepID=A0A7Y0LBW7_9GAMM|nr:MDR family oxidoreductase [Thalassotalea algicola]NMP31725.1 oxidoreductase [Thalassotalea algicola]
MFNAIVINKESEQYHSILSELDVIDLPEGDVLVNVEYSTINYKDALAITGQAPVVRQFPMIPGIDLVGKVEQSSNGNFKAGDLVLLNGFGVGESHMGGLAQKARLKGEWLIKLPNNISPYTAMAIGTAGYTAMLCVLALEQNGVSPQNGDVLVTGATGGVGSFAIGLLNKLGYRVVASTGDEAQFAYLTSLGASEIIARSELSEPGKPLMKERWAGAIDSVGSHTLANVCASTKYGGTVAACGLAQGMDFPATVAPFILRGITLAGIDSVMRPIADREEAWQRLSDLIAPSMIEQISTKIGLKECLDIAEPLLNGEVTGRIVVDVNA